MPAMTIAAAGFGAGTRELDDRPNLTQVVLGERVAGSKRDGQPVVELAANVDDATGEVLAHAVAALLAAGAHDAWLTPIVMKKGRPASTVHALVDVALVEQVAGVLAAETGTLGVRAARLERWPAPRRHERVVVDDLSVRVKVSPGRAKAEFDDAARVAERTGRPVREVIDEVERRWHEEGGTVDDAVRRPLHVADDADAEAARHTHDHPHDAHHDHPSHRHPPEIVPDPIDEPS